MGFKISKLKADGKRLSEGQWVTFGEDADGSKFELLLRPSGCREYDRALAGQARKDRKAMRNGAKLKISQIEAMTMSAVAKSILLDWRGLVDDNNEPITYSPEKALELFEANHEFYKGVTTMSGELQEDDDGDEEEELGNSLSASSGESSGALTKSD